MHKSIIVQAVAHDPQILVDETSLSQSKSISMEMDIAELLSTFFKNAKLLSGHPLPFLSRLGEASVWSFYCDHLKFAVGSSIRHVNGV